MSVSDSFIAFVLDQLAPLGDVTVRRMFGGAGVYLDDLFFAVLDDGAIYLKADDGNRPRHEKSGMSAFKPYADRPEVMQYYGVPVGVLESSDELVAWARDAVGAAARARARKATRPRPRSTRRRRGPTAR